MTANVSIQATLNNSANNFVISWALASGGGIISSIAPTKPYGNPFQVNIPSLTPNTTYIVTLWESVDTTPTGTVRNATNVIPSATTTTIRADDYLTADITPNFTNGTTAYVNTSYIGWTYDAERVGQGTQYPQGAPNVTDPDYAQDMAGGFHLLRTGDQFQPAEKWVIRFQPMVAPAEASNTGLFTTGEIINGFTLLTSADMNKALLLQGSSSNFTIGLPPLSSVSDFQWLYFFSAGGSHISAIIIPNGSDVIQRVQPIGTIVLCQNEQMTLFKYNGVWNIGNISASVDMSGEILYRYTQTYANGYGYNTVPADGRLLDRNDYYRLFQYFSNSGIVPVSEAAWIEATVIDGVTFYLNECNWTAGTNSSNFRIPQLQNWFLRGLNAGNTAGVAKYDTFKTHKHGTAVGLLPGAPFGKGTTTSNGARYANPQAGQPDLTDVAFNNASAGANGVILAGVGAETAPQHAQVPILFRI